MKKQIGIIGLGYLGSRLAEEIKNDFKNNKYDGYIFTIFI